MKRSILGIGTAVLVARHGLVRNVSRIGDPAR
jgi:hypothetical protein